MPGGGYRSWLNGERTVRQSDPCAFYYGNKRHPNGREHLPRADSDDVDDDADFDDESSYDYGQHFHPSRPTATVAKEEQEEETEQDEEGEWIDEEDDQGDGETVEMPRATLADFVVAAAAASNRRLSPSSSTYLQRRVQPQRSLRAEERRCARQRLLGELASLGLFIPAPEKFSQLALSELLRAAGEHLHAAEDSEPADGRQSMGLPQLSRGGGDASAAAAAAPAAASSALSMPLDVWNVVCDFFQLAPLLALSGTCTWMRAFLNDCDAWPRVWKHAHTAITNTRGSPIEALWIPHVVPPWNSYPKVSKTPLPRKRPFPWSWHLSLRHVLYCAAASAEFGAYYHSNAAASAAADVWTTKARETEVVAWRVLYRESSVELVRQWARIKLNVAAGMFNVALGLLEGFDFGCIEPRLAGWLRMPSSWDALAEWDRWLRLSSLDSVAENEHDAADDVTARVKPRDSTGSVVQFKPPKWGSRVEQTARWHMPKMTRERKHYHRGMSTVRKSGGIARVRKQIENVGPVSGSHRFGWQHINHRTVAPNYGSASQELPVQINKQGFVTSDARQAQRRV